jgi:hypothetical protein
MKFVPNKISKVVGRQALKLDKASPKVLFVSGIAGFGATVVLASRATLKAEAVLAETQAQLDQVNELKHSAYSENDRKHDKLVVYVRGARGLVKLYAPTIIVGSLSVLALTKSHNILQNRVAGLTAAYAALESSYGRYRQNVVDKFGEGVDKELYEDSGKVDRINPETGKKEKVDVVGEGHASPYAKLFDETTSKRWSHVPEQNQFFITCQQNYANDLLRAQGHVFLNEVYDLLGLERTKEGSVVGWVAEGDGDGYIDFGVFENNLFTGKQFVTGNAGSVWLDFNVDGIIYDKI